MAVGTDFDEDGDVFRGTPPHEEEGFYAVYEAKEVLGKGLASTVRKAIEKGTGQAFAVKIVDISTDKQSEKDAGQLLQETLSEVAILRQLSGHPSIITIHDFYRTPSFLFAVFEMAPRGELFDVLNLTVTVSEKKARRWMRQLFDGVAYMHERDIVHRDLKLENILCIDEDRIVISDFGFAMHLKKGTFLKELCGTPGYLAPEAIRSQMYEDAPGYHHLVDEWALGVIMFTLLAGYAPFYHRKQLMMMRMIQEGRFQFLHEQWSTVTQEAKDLAILDNLRPPDNVFFSITGLLCVPMEKRLTAEHCLIHPWMGAAAAPVEEDIRKKKDYKKLFKLSIVLVRFFIRLQKVKYYKTVVDREAIRKRPFRDRDIRHEAEAAVFSVYGHWVNRGFHYSRDMLFANQPRPKYVKEAKS